MQRHKLVIVALMMVLAGAVSAMALTAQEVLQKVEDRYIGKTSKANVQMDIVDKTGNARERKLTISRRKADGSNKDNFIHFVAPPDIRNTTYLVNEKNKVKEKHIYLSAFKKVRKILAEDYAMAFVSSDFTYEDMDDVRAEDYVATNLKEEKLGDVDVYSIEVSKKDQNTNYSRSIMKVCKNTLVVLRTELFDKKDPTKMIKLATAEDMEKIQDIWTPKKVTMKDLVNGTHTVLQTAKVAYDLPLSDEEFSRRNMEK